LHWNFDHKTLEVCLQTHLLNRVNKKQLERDEAEMVGQAIKSFLYSDDARFLRLAIAVPGNIIKETSIVPAPGSGEPQ
jgi:hypothetical protein